MQFILEGLTFGLILSISLGPIFIALTQTAIEKGARAGITVASGVWISDFIIVGLFYFFISKISTTVESEAFQFWIALIGGLFLMSFGFFSFFRKVELDYTVRKHVYKDYIGFWLKGFLINTLNPFTFLFWLTTISTRVIAESITSREAGLFLASILFMIMLSDSIKVFLAKAIKSKLKPIHIENLGKVAGVALFLFGGYLIWRGLQ